MTEKEELEALRELLVKIGYALIGAEAKGTDTINKLMTEIRYGYLYNLTHGDKHGDGGVEEKRISSIKRMLKM